MLRLNVRRYETAVYAVAWTIALAAPVVLNYVDTQQAGVPFLWSVVFNSWMGFLPFFVLFWLHDILLAPLLMRSRGIRKYILGIILAVAAFTAVQCATSGQHRHDRPGGPPPCVGMPGDNPSKPVQPKEKPAATPGEPDFQPVDPAGLVNIAVAIMMCGLNVAVKLYFKARREERAIAELERQNLQKELEYLKYQINPHFFMNTLNNIHALIDLDPGKAKTAVIELSKMMRYVLYEGTPRTAPLGHELDFLRSYISLMKLRYTGNVDIRTDLPQAVPDLKIPPLLLVTFVENAFKHGISYRKPSFIDISVKIEGNLITFSCRNSVVQKETDKPGGVGIANTRKRLDLIYGDSYKLDVKPGADTFSVLLTIPLAYD